MRSRPFLDSILSSSSRTVLPKINQDELNLVPVPLPPLEEQKQITKQIEKFLFLADQLESDYEAAKSQLDDLSQSLLSKAFRGELCTPEPGAESAKILLARIRKEKARLEILEKEQRSQIQARKMKSEKKSDLKALAAVLETSKGEWIPARMAWQQSEHRDDIEGFYAELKRLIETEQTVEEEKRGKESYLRMTQA
jgi:type I restriction enzyme S subunit